MKVKKIISCALAAALCLSLASCTNKNDDNSKDNDSNQSQVKEIRDISAFDLVKEMKIGWNLGNTLDATGGSGIESETSWQNEVTSKKMVDTVKQAGFNVLRVPTTWDIHVDENFNIDKEWLDRVQEVVDYGIDNDMFVILNIHHEEWHFPSYDNLDSAKEKLVKLWEQISERFKNYDEHLIFEGLNEPRKKNTPQEWTGGDSESRDVVNQFNAAFVETVRNSGGNNISRHLMIPTYAASSTSSCLNDMVIPKDDDKIIVSVHAYLPYDFALNTKGTDQWSIDNTNDTQSIDKLFEDLDMFFLSQNIPVIIGEFGSVNKINDNLENNLEARVACGTYYISKAKEHGVPCVWWDNAGFIGSGENFGLLVRSDLTWSFPALVEAITAPYKD